jgi:hypothetical protein
MKNAFRIKNLKHRHILENLKAVIAGNKTYKTRKWKIAPGGR